MMADIVFFQELSDAAFAILIFGLKGITHIDDRVGFIIEPIDEGLIEPRAAGKGGVDITGAEGKYEHQFFTGFLNILFGPGDNVPGSE